MEGKNENSSPANELQFELKYCERCGGLWLRPAGGKQIYCVACGRAMADLPSSSTERASARMSQGPRWATEDGDIGGYDGDEGIDLDGAGGVA
jgi:hypothetical protein